MDYLLLDALVVFASVIVAIVVTTVAMLICVSAAIFSSSHSEE